MRISNKKIFVFILSIIMVLQLTMAITAKLN